MDWRPHIVVVEDEAAGRQLLIGYLSKRGYRVTGFASGVGLRRLVEREIPNLVLLDIGLPDVEGFEVARSLADDGQPPYVVLTSSREATEYGPRLTTSRALGFLPKDELSGPAIRALADAV